MFTEKSMEVDHMSLALKECKPAKDPSLRPRYTVDLSLMPRYTVDLSLMPRYTVGLSLMPRYTVGLSLMPRYTVGPSFEFVFYSKLPQLYVLIYVDVT